jgi:hypothetical protein
MSSSRGPPTSCALRLGKPYHPTMPLAAVVAKRVRYVSSYSRPRRPAPAFARIGARRSARIPARRRRFRATTRVDPGHLLFEIGLRPWGEPKRHAPCNGSNRYVGDTAHPCRPTRCSPRRPFGVMGLPSRAIRTRLRALRPADERERRVLSEL